MQVPHQRPAAEPFLGFFPLGVATHPFFSVHWDIFLIGGCSFPPFPPFPWGLAPSARTPWAPWVFGGSVPVSSTPSSGISVSSSGTSGSGISPPSSIWDSSGAPSNSTKRYLPLEGLGSTKIVKQINAKVAQIF